MQSQPNKRPFYHFIGIGGIGMSALAKIALDQGYHVSGSDVSPSYVTKALEKAGISVAFGHSEQNIPEATTAVVYSTAVRDSNPELQEAKRRRLPLLHRSDLLSEFLRASSALCVTGTHGKTTTSSLLAHTLEAASRDPSYALGGFVSSLGGNGKRGNGSYFVAEADESDGSFLKHPAYGAIVTNIDFDHMEYWKSEQALIGGFQTFLNNVDSSNHLFWCGDDDRLVKLKPSGVSYGFSTHCDLRIEAHRQEGWRLIFDLTFEGRAYTAIEVPMIGAYNVLNAAAVFGLCLRLGLSPEEIRTSFSSFRGVCRRVEQKGIYQQAVLFDDYAHHPTEILSTLGALKKCVNGGRLVVAFQPHRYTRTQACLEQFGAAFAPADEVIITEIYAAGEDPLEGMDKMTLYRRVMQERPHGVHYSTRSDLSQFLASFLKPNDLFVTMGAGDITKVGPELLEREVLV